MCEGWILCIQHYFSLGVHSTANHNPVLSLTHSFIHSCIYALTQRALIEHLYCAKPNMHVCKATSVVSSSVRPHGLQHVRFLSPWVSPVKNTGVKKKKKEYWSELHAPLQGIFPTQGSNLHLLHFLHWQVDSLPLAPPGKSRRS